MEEKDLLTQEEIIQVFENLKKVIPNPTSELQAPNAYCFLVSVVLSAQATDKSVNKATSPLYERVKTPKQMLDLGLEGLIPYIRSIGLYNTKAHHIMELSDMLIKDFNSTVPDNREDLMKLPGVGRKTSNVVLNVIYNKPTVPVDTHLFRVAPKIGLARGSTPLEVEESLLQRIPSEYLKDAHHYLLLHGRYTCTARNSKCNICVIRDLCLYNLCLCNRKK